MSDNLDVKFLMGPKHICVVLHLMLCLINVLFNKCFVMAILYNILSLLFAQIFSLLTPTCALCWTSVLLFCLGLLVAIGFSQSNGSIFRSGRRLAIHLMHFQTSQLPGGLWRSMKVSDHWNLLIWTVTMIILFWGQISCFPPAVLCTGSSLGLSGAESYLIYNLSPGNYYPHSWCHTYKK